MRGALVYGREGNDAVGRQYLHVWQHVTGQAFEGKHAVDLALDYFPHDGALTPSAEPNNCQGANKIFRSCRGHFKEDCPSVRNGGQAISIDDRGGDIGRKGHSSRSG